MALSHTPLPNLCFARNHTNFLLLSHLSFQTYCLSAIKFLERFACCCISFVHLHDKWNYTCTPAPYVDAQMPRTGKRATATQIYFTSTKYYAHFVVERFFIFCVRVLFFGCSTRCSTVFYPLPYSVLPTSSTPKKIIFIFCGVIFAHI